MINSKHSIVLFLFSTILLNVINAFAEEKQATDNLAIPAEVSGELYLPSDDPLATVQATVDTARESNKLALVIMGANWCHDSRGLASRFHQEPLKSLIEENYETIFVDVGFLNKGQEVIESLGPPVYYATPTVLIIDPVSGQLVNEFNRHQWAEAYSINMTRTISYFQQMSDLDLTHLRAAEELNVELQRLLADINAFERKQADRLYQAYAILGPMLKKYKEGDTEAFSEQKWNEVREFRYKVPQDVDALKIQARERVLAGESEIELEFPTYVAFSWQAE